MPQGISLVGAALVLSTSTRPTPPSACSALTPRVSGPASNQFHLSQMRQRICECVQGGDIDAALDLTRQLAPGLLAGNRRIHFRLQCQKFAEMVGAG